MDDDSENWFDQVMNSVVELFVFGCSMAMVFGGAVPYIPQYLDIKRTGNTEGFSLFVCLTLIIANVLRILFWFGHHFELPLLYQSIIMLVTMFAMIHLNVKVKNRTLIIKSRERLFTDFDWRYFWEWTDFLSYVEFISLFTAFFGVLMYLFIEYTYFVESIGFAAVFMESMLGVPQLYRNFKNKSTAGMSKKMVVMWTMGDTFKTGYFILREAPVQFTLCAFLQVSVDFFILCQVAMYRHPPVVRIKPDSK